MSHTLSKVNLGNNALAAILIQNYVQGGETFTLAELGLTSVTGVYLIPLNSLQGVPLPMEYDLVLGSGGSVKLMSKASGDTQECSTTTGLNYGFLALVVGTI